MHFSSNQGSSIKQIRRRGSCPEERKYLIGTLSSAFGALGGKVLKGVLGTKMDLQMSVGKGKGGGVWDGYEGGGLSGKLNLFDGQEKDAGAGNTGC